VEMILLDWTRMGRSYCLAGALAQDGGYRTVRPLLARYRDAPVRNVGWSAYQLDGHVRWEVFELIGAEAASPDPPHLEDLWVRSLRPCRRLAPPSQRRDILAQTTVAAGEPLFGAPLLTTRAAAYLETATGLRSLATLTVPAHRLRLSGCWRAGSAESDIRVTLPLCGREDRSLAVCRAEQAGTSLDAQVKFLTASVQAMGEQVAVRLGLSRGFQSAPGKPAAVCWLMADGFFSVSDPQP
jgi:hypothetical protein